MRAQGETVVKTGEPSRPGAPSPADAARVESALRERLSRLESSIDGGHVGIWEWNVQTGLVVCNDCWAMDLGYTPAELRPLSIETWRGLTQPDDLREHSRQLERHFAGELAQCDCEWRLRHRAGHWVWMHCRGRLVSRTVDGKPLMMAGVQIDISARKQADDAAGQARERRASPLDSSARERTEGALRDSEAFLATIYQNSDIGIFVVEVAEDGEYTYSGVNPTYERLLAVKKDDVVGRKPRDLIGVIGLGAVEYIEDLYGRCVRARAPVESEFHAAVGPAQGWWLCRVTPLFAADGGRVTQLIGSSLPISSRKRAEEALRESEERLRLAVQASNVGLFDWELGSLKVRYSREWKAQLGYQEHEVGDGFDEWQSRLHPDDRPAALARLERYVVAPLGPYESEFRLRHKDGSWRWIYARGELMRDEKKGGAARLLGCHVDVTDRRSLEEQLRHSQRMDAVGQLAGGVAHDFNNLLTVIQGNATLLQDDAEPLSAEQQEAVAELLRATERAATLTRQLLTFSRRQRIDARRLDLNVVVRDSFSMLQRLLGEDIRLRLELEPTPLAIRADPGLLKQVLVNLAVNAREAMPSGGQLLVETHRVQLPQADVSDALEAKPGPYARLRVTDSGSGIMPEHLAHIFEPFFTTKEVGKGTGLGLATVFGIVRQHGGSVRVTSELERGSSFDVYLPELPSDSRDSDRHLFASAAATQSQARGGPEAILLVEDEESVRRLVQRVLREAGYRVLTAASGAEALSLLEEDDFAVDLVLTDLIMPGGISGQDLGRRVRELRPDQRILYMSGYPSDHAGHDVPDKLRLDAGARTLTKPFTPASLLDSVRACLKAI